MFRQTSSFHKNDTTLCSKDSYNGFKTRIRNKPNKYKIINLANLLGKGFYQEIHPRFVFKTRLHVCRIDCRILSIFPCALLWLAYCLLLMLALRSNDMRAFIRTFITLIIVIICIKNFSLMIYQQEICSIFNLVYSFVCLFKLVSGCTVIRVTRKVVS